MGITDKTTCRTVRRFVSHVRTDTKRILKRDPRKHEKQRLKKTMKVVCASKSMPRLALKSSSSRRARCTMSVSNKNKQVVSASKLNGKANQVAMAAALTTLTASAPAFAAVNEVGQVAGAEFLPSILVPLVGLVFPGIAMAAFFIYAETEEIS